MSTATAEPEAVDSTAVEIVPHDHAVGHVTGTATFIDDVPRRQDELYLGIVASQGLLEKFRKPVVASAA